MTDDRTQSADRSELRAPGTSRVPVRNGAPDIPHTEEALDRLVHLACRILGAERVVVTLPGEHRQLVEGCKGVEAALAYPSELKLADGRRVGCLGVVDAATRQFRIYLPTAQRE